MINVLSIIGLVVFGFYYLYLNYLTYRIITLLHKDID